MINISQIFTWWKGQTFGTFLKTFFTGKLVGKDENGNKYYKNKYDERWIVYAGNVEASKINSDWYLWMHHTTNEIPTDDPPFTGFITYGIFISFFRSSDFD